MHTNFLGNSETGGESNSPTTNSQNATNDSATKPSPPNSNALNRTNFRASKCNHLFLLMVIFLKCLSKLVIVIIDVINYYLLLLNVSIFRLPFFFKYFYFVEKKAYFDC